MDVARAAREELFGAMDAANVDLKAFTGSFYARLCSGKLGAVLETLEYPVHETGVWIEITPLLIPGQNDGRAEIALLSEWVLDRLGPDVPLHFTAFHPDFRMRDVPPTPAAALRMARDIARAAGLRHVYTGNVHDEAGQSTYCPGCSARVIGRDRYRITAWSLDGDDDGDGRCARCATLIPGRFAARPGLWGPRRAPLRIGGDRRP